MGGHVSQSCVIIPWGSFVRLLGWRSNHHHRGRAERDFSAGDFLDLLLRLDRDATGERGRRRRTGGG